MPKLTKDLIDSTPCPSKGQSILRDEDLPGFGLRLSPTCKTFIVEGEVNGTRKRVSIGRCGTINVEAARTNARQVLGEMASGVDIVAQRRSQGPSVLEVLNDFLNERQMAPPTKLAYRQMMTRLLPDWFDLPIASITREIVLIRHHELLRPTRIGTSNGACANSVMHILRVLINYACDKYSVNGEPLLKDNPVDCLKRRWHHETVRQGVIADSKLAEFYRAIMACPSKICRDFILLLLFSGLRRNEAAKMKWEDINFEENTLTIPARFNKSRREHVLPMTDFIVALLKSRQNGESEYVFPGRNRGHLKEPKANLAHLRKKMGWHWLIHDLRRSMLSCGEKVGVPLPLTIV